MISNYLEMRDLPPLGDETGSNSLLLASMRKSKKNAEGGVTRSGLYVILSNFLGNVADSIKKERPLDAAKLRTSSTHWLRHTFSVTSLEVMRPGDISFRTKKLLSKPLRRNLIFKTCQSALVNKNIFISKEKILHHQLRI